jgi:hypothetical protein
LILPRSFALAPERPPRGTTYSLPKIKKT